MRGYFVLLGSAFFYASYGIFSKIIGSSFGPFTLSWTRGAITLALLIIFGLVCHQFGKMNKKYLKWYTLIGFFSALSIAPGFYSFVHLHLGTALFIQYAGTVITSFALGIFWLKERVTNISFLSLLLVFLGLLMVYWGDIKFSPGNTLPAIAAFASGAFFSAWFVVVRKLRVNRLSK